MAGVARGSVSRARSEWRRRGIVKRVSGKMLRVDRSQLEGEAAAVTDDLLKAE
jgi:hypothetical protein